MLKFLFAGVVVIMAWTDAHALGTNPSFTCCIKAGCVASSLIECRTTCSYCYPEGFEKVCAADLYPCTTQQNIRKSGNSYIADVYGYDDDCNCVSQNKTEVVSCVAGYYMTTGNTCAECPAPGTSVDQNTSGNTSCYIPAGKNITDDTGTYDFSEDCYYTPLGTLG